MSARHDRAQATSPREPVVLSPNPAENYERHFVPAISAPVAIDLLAVAAPRAGERVLDVACGTGVVTRLAAAAVGESGSVVGLDVNPAMLGVAKAVTPPESEVRWREASAEAIPFSDATFDLVLSQLGLQFVPDRPAAVHEMRRVLAPGGRLALNVAGRAGEIFEAAEPAFERHLGPPAGAFVRTVFSLHDPDSLRTLLEDGGFHDIEVRVEPKRLRVPAPREFLWQYVFGTPLAIAARAADAEQRTALEREVVVAWNPFVEGNGMRLEQDIVVATARA
jgi:ubiquinone/menaquinone biosynthesis C-methylase UbiE